MENKVNFLGF